MKVNSLYLKYIPENYLAFLPDFKKKKTRNITTLVLTLLGISFFAIFAINPTLSTIAQLNKQLSDSQFVETTLTTKIENLSILQRKYDLLKTRLPVVFSAIPKTPSAVNLEAEVQKIAQDSDVQINQLQTVNAQLSGTSFVKNIPAANSFIFFVGVKGNYNDLLTFVNSLAGFDRIITIDSISIHKTSVNAEVLECDIRAKAYYMQ